MANGKTMFSKKKLSEDTSQLCLDSCLWARFFMFVLELSNFPGINGFLAAILAKICFRHSQADLGLEAA